MFRCMVNKKEYVVEKDQKLIRFLRDELKLKSVKDGCSQGSLRHLYGAGGREGCESLHPDDVKDGRQRDPHGGRYS